MRYCDCSDLFLNFFFNVCKEKLILIRGVVFCC